MSLNNQTNSRPVPRRYYPHRRLRLARAPARPGSPRQEIWKPGKALQASGIKLRSLGSDVGCKGWPLDPAYMSVLALRRACHSGIEHFGEFKLQAQIRQTRNLTQPRMPQPFGKLWLPCGNTQWEYDTLYQDRERCPIHIPRSQL